MDKEKKSWWQSKTILSGLFVIGISVAKGIDTHFGTNFLSIETTTALTTIAAAFGIYGRTVTTKGIKK